VSEGCGNDLPEEEKEQELARTGSFPPEFVRYRSFIEWREWPVPAQAVAAKP
jgi:hypothetical protein